MRGLLRQRLLFLCSFFSVFSLFTSCKSSFNFISTFTILGVKILKKLPHDYRDTFAETREYFYGEYDVDGTIYRKQNIETLTDMLCWKIMVSAGLRAYPEDNYEISIEDSIKLYNKAIDVFKIHI